MCIPQIATLGLIGLLFLSAGCSKMPADEAADVRKSFGLPPDMPLKDLGVVELQVGTPKRLRAGWGKECIITATALTNGLMQLHLRYESSGEVIDGEKTQSYSEQSRIVFRPGVKGPICFSPMRPYFVITMQPSIIGAENSSSNRSNKPLDGPE